MYEPVSKEVASKMISIVCEELGAMVPIVSETDSHWISPAIAAA